MVVRSKQCAATSEVVQVLGDSPGDGESIKGGRAAADFIKNNKREISRIIKNERGFIHLDHEGGLSA